MHAHSQLALKILTRDHSQLIVLYSYINLSVTVKNLIHGNYCFQSVTIDGWTVYRDSCPLSSRQQSPQFPVWGGDVKNPPPPFFRLVLYSEAIVFVITWRKKLAQKCSASDSDLFLTETWSGQKGPDPDPTLYLKTMQLMQRTLQYLEQLPKTSMQVKLNKFLALVD